MRVDLLDLAERVERASGPCVGLDADIALAVGHWQSAAFDAWWHYQECGESANPPLHTPVPPSRYTASIDAAMSLVPEDALMSLLKVRRRSSAENVLVWQATVGNRSADAASPALALCAAALRSLANESSPND